MTRLFGALPEATTPPVRIEVDGYGDEESVARQLSAVLVDVTLEAITAAAGSLLLHAGGVARPDGSCAIVCGQSGSGKSTLTAGLVRTGLAYLTDETVCLDPATLRVTPFRRPLSLKSGSHEVLARLRPPAWDDGTWLVAPDALGGAALPTAPLLPELLVFPTYRAGAGCEVEPVSAAEAAFLAGTHSSRLRETTTGALDALARLARRAPAYRLVHGDHDTAVSTICQLLDAA